MTKLKFTFFFCVCITFVNAQIDYLILKEIVTDEAQLFTQGELTRLREKLTTYETKTTHQIVVLTINNLGNNTVESYAYKVFNENGIGQKGVDNGILILIAKADRQFRIEVGKGFEPIITDAYASRIIRKTITPRFKENAFYKGVDEGTSEIIKLIEDPKYREEFKEATDAKSEMPFLLKLFIGVFLVAFLGVFLAVGCGVFYIGYKMIINAFRGLITGRVSVITFPFILISSLFPTLFGLPFIFIPIAFGTMILSSQINEDSKIDIFSKIPEVAHLETSYIIGIPLFFFLGIPLIIAFFTRSRKKHQPLGLSLFKSDKKYMSRHFSSSGSRSGNSSSRSSWSSSSSSFSGGGGSSGGGGASGSW